MKPLPVLCNREFESSVTVANVALPPLLTLIVPLDIVRRFCTTAEPRLVIFSSPLPPARVLPIELVTSAPPINFEPEPSIFSTAVPVPALPICMTGELTVEPVSDAPL